VGVAVLLVIGALVVGGVFYLRYRARQQRIRGVAALAQRLGFGFRLDDEDHIADMPFALFSRGDGHEADLVVSGTHNGMRLRMFDFMYYENNSDGRGNRSRTYHRFTCAILQIPAACPPLCLDHEDFLTKLGRHVGIHDVELEYDEFNKRFRVKCKEQKFAFTLLDGDMMQWLLDGDGFETLEVVGPWVLLAVNRLDPARWPDLGTWLDQFHAHVPPLVFSTYPPS
jgi:hypothetical protein